MTSEMYIQFANASEICARNNSASNRGIEPVRKQNVIPNGIAALPKMSFQGKSMVKISS